MGIIETGVMGWVHKIVHPPPIYSRATTDTRQSLSDHLETLPAFLEEPM